MPTRPRDRLVQDLRAKRVLVSDEVADAFLAVPRERFIPHVLGESGLEAVYRDEAFVVKQDARGRPLSSSSQPALMAKMLELLELRPGHRVLEVGSGTGYNAALLAHLVGFDGRVTSVDIDPQLVRDARRALREAGYRASLHAGDGREGHSGGAPYDRIIVTAGADEIPRAWREQLCDGGLLELPLRLDRDWSAIQIIPVFKRAGEQLKSVAFTWGGFMPVHGGDGGWRTPPVSLTARRSAPGRHAWFGSLSGQALSRLPDSAARRLLAELITARARPRAQGQLQMSSSHPPLLLLYLLSRIPDSRRVAVDENGRMGVGILHVRSGSIAVVSVPSPWRTQGKWNARARWRLDAYGGETAATELEQLLQRWRDLNRAGKPHLSITADGLGQTLRIRLHWSGSRTSSPDRAAARK